MLHVLIIDQKYIIDDYILWKLLFFLGGVTDSVVS